MTALAKLTVAAALGLPLMLVACGGDDDGDSVAPPTGSFVGTVEGSNAYVAVLSDGEEAFGYLCDGKRVSAWLVRAPVDDGDAELVDRSGESLGRVSFDGSASGEVRIGGQTLAFDAEPATGEAGLYRDASGAPGEPGFAETGWIVLADGSVRGATTKFIDQEGDFVVGPAPPRSPSATKLTPGFVETGTDI